MTKVYVYVPEDQIPTATIMGCEFDENPMIQCWFTYSDNPDLEAILQLYGPEKDFGPQVSEDFSIIN